MMLSLKTKRQNKCFHLRGVKHIRENRQGIMRLEGIRFHDIYEKTRFKDYAYVELEIPHDDSVKAYYLCGVSKGSEYHENLGVAFVPCSGHCVCIDNEKVSLKITDAREIGFNSCDPIIHIFARYVENGMSL